MAPGRIGRSAAQPSKRHAVGINVADSSSQFLLGKVNVKILQGRMLALTLFLTA
jgi:hypothetical protein